MKKLLLFFIAIFFITTCSIAQESDSTKFLSEYSNKACKCIDSINLAKSGNDEVLNQINKCIDEQVEPFELMTRLYSSLKTPNTKNIDVNIYVDKNSQGYKQYYYDIERWLMDSCSSIKKAVAQNNTKHENSISKNPKALEQYNLGIDQLNKENFKDAIIYLNNAIEIDSTFAFAWDNLGLSYRKDGDYDDALQAYQKSLSLDPKGRMPLENIPVVYEYKKDYDNALKAYKNIATIYPDDPETFYGIGRVYIYGKNDLENGLDNMCKAYNIYIKTNSPYRTDAEKQIRYIYAEMKKNGKEDKFNSILKANNISTD